MSLPDSLATFQTSAFGQDCRSTSDYAGLALSSYWLGVLPSAIFDPARRLGIAATSSGSYSLLKRAARPSCES